MVTKRMVPDRLYIIGSIGDSQTGIYSILILTYCIIVTYGDGVHVLGISQNYVGWCGCSEYLAS